MVRELKTVRGYAQERFITKTPRTPSFTKKNDSHDGTMKQWVLALRREAPFEHSTAR
jgi:hypothetical protein